VREGEGISSCGLPPLIERPKDSGIKIKVNISDPHSDYWDLVKEFTDYVDADSGPGWVNQERLENIKKNSIGKHGLEVSTDGRLISGGGFGPEKDYLKSLEELADRQHALADRRNLHFIRSSSDPAHRVLAAHSDILLNEQARGNTTAQLERAVRTARTKFKNAYQALMKARKGSKWAQNLPLRPKKGGVIAAAVGVGLGALITEVMGTKSSEPGVQAYLGNSKVPGNEASPLQATPYARTSVDAI
jgi:hypothetical protein